MKVPKGQSVNKIKTALHLDSHTRKQDGKAQFLLRVYVGNRKYIYIRTGRYMQPKFWVEKKIVAKKGNPLASELKSYLDGLVGKCEKIVNRKISEGKSITKKQLERELFEQNHDNTKCTIPFGQYLKSVVDSEYAKGKIVEKTKKNYLWGLKHINGFDGDAPIIDVDAEWLEGFLDHMKFTSKLSDNSISAILNYTKKIIHHAIYQDGILEKDPFKKFEFSRANEGDKEFLTVMELRKLHKIYMNGYYTAIPGI